VDELRCRQEALLATVDATLDPEAQQQLEAVQQRLGKVPEYREKCAALARAMVTAERRRAALSERSSRLRAATAITVANVSGSDGHSAAGSAAADATTLQTPLFSEAGQRFAYRVVYPGGVSVRSAPSIDSTKTGVVLKAGSFLEASERLVPAYTTTEESTAGAVANDVFVRLVDGSGWVFEAKGSTPILERVTPMRLDREVGAHSGAAATKSDDSVAMGPQAATQGITETLSSSSEDTTNVEIGVKPPPTPEDDVSDAVFEEGDV